MHSFCCVIMSLRTPKSAVRTGDSISARISPIRKSRLRCTEQEDRQMTHWRSKNEDIQFRERFENAVGVNRHGRCYLQRPASSLASGYCSLTSAGILTTQRSPETEAAPGRATSYASPCLLLETVAGKASLFFYIHGRLAWIIPTRSSV